MAQPPPGMPADEQERLRFALELRGALDQRLCAIAPVWFDRSRLNPGDEWEAAIVTALHACQGAVLLLTPEALKSPWVLREATVLADRRGRWSGLRLVPVLCAGVDYKTLAADPYWAALDITRWQPVQASRGAFRGAAAQLDSAEIVEQVVAQMQGLADPQDPRHAGWAQELRAFLDDLARRGLTTRLQGAAKALGLKAPLQWDGDAMQQLAHMLLQTGAVETGADGQARYPLVEALAGLIPGDPEVTPRSDDEQKFCAQLRPLAAPPAMAVAVAAAGSGAAGRSAPVLLRTGDRRVLELAAYRASCNAGWVRPLSGVMGEGAEPSAADLLLVGKAVARARMAGLDCFVVASLQPLAGEDPAALVQSLGRRLPADAKLVGAVDRAWPAAPAAVVDVPETDEDATVLVAEHIDLMRGGS